MLIPSSASRGSQMIWPFLPNYAQRTRLFESLGTSQARYIVNRWEEYQSDVPRLRPEDIRVIEAVAMEILTSFQTALPVSAVLVQGHADVALRLPSHDRASFELRISQARAEHVAQSLYSSLLRQSGGLGMRGRNMLDLMLWSTEFFGSRERVNTHPKTEAEMSMNRRAEIFLARSVVASSDPLIICPHGGNVIRVTRNAFVPKASDVWIVAGCPFAANIPSPCQNVEWVVTSPDGVIDATSLGLCMGPSGSQGQALILTH